MYIRFSWVIWGPLFQVYFSIWVREALEGVQMVQVMYCVAEKKPAGERVNGGR